MKLNHVLWDWNGTLLDDVPLVVRTLNEILGPRAMPPVTEADYRRIFRFPVREYYKDLGFDFDNDDWEQVTADFKTIYLKNIEAAPLRTGVTEALRFLQKTGVGMSILSAAEEQVLRQLVVVKGIDVFFDGIYGLDNHYAASKMDTGKKAVGKIGVDRHSMLIVGDTQHDYEVARELGTGCVLVCGGHQADDRLRACGCDVLTDMADLTDYIDSRGTRCAAR